MLRAIEYHSRVTHPGHRYRHRYVPAVYELRRRTHSGPEAFAPAGMVARFPVRPGAARRDGLCCFTAGGRVRPPLRTFTLSWTFPWRTSWLTIAGRAHRQSAG